MSESSESRVPAYGAGHSRLTSKRWNVHSERNPSCSARRATAQMFSAVAHGPLCGNENPSSTAAV